MKEMAEISEVRPFTRIPEGQPLYLQFVRGHGENQVVLNTQLVGLSEEESQEDRLDPFKIIDTKTGKEIKPLQRERIQAYMHPRVQAMHIHPPEDLVQGLNTFARIRQRKTKPESFQSLIETT